MGNRSKGYYTKWATQFYAAAELTRRGYLVSLTLGNAPVVDMLVVSPSGKQFTVDVKGLSNPNFWLIRRREGQVDLFYILIYLPPEGKPPRYFVLSSFELMAKREEYKEHIESKGGKYRDDLGGINWSTAFDYENQWGKLPQ